ncbi:DUF4405 domain-containing protein [Candidatus Sumerlaeota bacterium]|nr:DUF4405 domain-containing protein [Candidatus Sumerlaeota bacterium]
MNETPSPDKPPKSFHWRGLTSFIVTLGFLLMAVTGIALYLSPQGRVARWTNWRLVGLDREQWIAVHMIAGILFIIAAGFHLYFNWGIFIRYIRTKAGFNLKLEMALALAIVAIVVAGTLWELPPFKYVPDASDRIKAYWNEQSVAAPYAHAEESTLEEFARRTDVPLEEIQARLAELGVESLDASQTITEVADRLGISPKTLFDKLNLNNGGRGRGGSGARGQGGAGGRGQGGSAERVQGGGGERGQGGSSGRRGAGGWGRQTLQEVCDAENIDLQAAISALDSSGIRASGHETIRTISDRAGRTPSEVLSMIGARNRGRD